MQMYKTRRAEPRDITLPKTLLIVDLMGLIALMENYE